MIPFQTLFDTNTVYTNTFFLLVYSFPGETRGGCLATTKNLDGRSEVVFSYSDRIPEVNADDFRTVLNNFVETAASLRNKLLMRVYTDMLPIPQSSMHLLGAPDPKRIRRNN
jgi:hypothetical protein